MPSIKKLLQAAAGNAGESLYVEDVFSTYLYNGVPLDTPKTITNGIDLAGQGGLVWTKRRSNSRSHVLFDSERSNNAPLYSDLTNAEGSEPYTITMNSDGYTWSKADNDTSYGESDTFVGWTFRKAEKFFDVVTYTGDDVSGREIAHNLGSTPAVIIVKKTNGTYNWQIYHSALGATKFLEFTTGASQTSSAVWNDTAPTDSVFTVGNEYGVNQSGDTYVAYLFAHDAGGFGDDGDESIIKCGSYVGDGTSDFSKNINLGFEPQWVLVKRASSTGNWFLIDTMRGMPVNQNNSAYIFADLSAAEQTLGTPLATPTATGFNVAGTNINNSGVTVIYIAIRRPMKTPESGTEVFDPSFRITGDPTVASGFVTDMGIVASRNGGATSTYHLIGSRLTGNLGMTTTSTLAEVSKGEEPLKWDYNDGWGGSDTASSFAAWYSFKRATGFFDVVAYTGTGTAQTLSHNLGVVPELIIEKRRDGVAAWLIYNEASGNTKYMQFSSSAEATSAAAWNNTSPTLSEFTVGTGASVSGGTHIAYLFATLDGVSKVGSYTGTGSNVDVDCGFSAGARFILIKRTDSTGDWYVWDSVRGIVAGNDPYLLLNSTALEVTNTDYIDPLSSGFTVTSSAPAALNASGGTYIFLSIA